MPELYFDEIGIENFFKIRILRMTSFYYTIELYIEVKCGAFFDSQILSEDFISLLQCAKTMRI